MDRRIIAYCKRIAVLDKDYLHKKREAEELRKQGLESEEDTQKFIWLINSREQSEEARDYLIKKLILHVIKTYKDEYLDIIEEVVDYENR